MNTSRSPSIGPDPGVNRSGRPLVSVGVWLLHAQFPSPRSAAMNAIIDATLTARAPRGAATRSIGGFPGRTSMLSCEAGDEDDISISFQSLPLDEGNSSGAVRRRCADLLSSSV